MLIYDSIGKATLLFLRYLKIFSSFFSSHFSSLSNSQGFMEPHNTHGSYLLPWGSRNPLNGGWSIKNSEQSRGGQFNTANRSGWKSVKSWLAFFSSAAASPSFCLPFSRPQNGGRMRGAPFWRMIWKSFGG